MTRTLSLLGVLGLMAALLAAPATAGDTSVVAPPTILKKQIAQVKTDSGLDVYLPSRLRVFVKASRVRGSAGGTDTSYSLDLGVGSRCNGANACFLAEFTGAKGAKPSYRKKVKLTGGRTGYWKGITCGASCSPAEIQFKVGDVLYSIATKGVSQKAEKSTLVRLANSALKAGPR